MAKETQIRDTLLVAVDFTSFSKEAMLFAANLAGKLNARLLVLHVIHDPAEAPGFYVQKGKKKKYLNSMEEAAEEMMTGFLKNFRQAFPAEESIQEAVPMLVIGTPAVRIVEVAKKEKVSMIIVGSHGRTGMSKILIGSKAERVVRLSTVPVTVVKSVGKKNENRPS